MSKTEGKEKFRVVSGIILNKEYIRPGKSIELEGEELKAFKKTQMFKSVKPMKTK